MGELEDRDAAIREFAARQPRRPWRPFEIAQRRYGWTDADIIDLETGGQTAVTKAMELLQRKLDSLTEMGQ